MSELTSLRNIGKELERKLKSIGIATVEELREIGCEEAFLRLKIKYPKVCLVHLYSLEGAISDIDYNKLAENVKQRLKSFSDGLKQRS